MEKIKEGNILGIYTIKYYTSDGMGFTDILHNLADGFKPLDVEIEETVDRDMKTFGKKTIPYDEYMNTMDSISTGVNDCVFSLVGTAKDSLVTVTAVEDVISLSSKNSEIEIDDVISKKKVDQVVSSFSK